MKKICKRIAALLLGIVMLSNVLLVNAAEQYSDKIDADLQEVMEKAAEEELIEIWLWLDDPITDKMIEQMLLVAIQIMEDMLLIMEVVLLMQVFVKVLVRILLIMIRRVFLGQCLDIVFH